MLREMFVTWEPEIRKCCEENGLGFNKAEAMPKAWNKDFLLLLYSDPNEKTMGLLDETPAPIVLRMELVDESRYSLKPGTRSNILDDINR